MEQNTDADIAAVDSSSTGLMREQVRLLGVLSESLQLLVQAAAARDADGMERQLSVQSSLCLLIRRSQQEIEVKRGGAPVAVVQKSQSFQELLQAVAGARSRLRIANALLPRLRHSARVMLSVLAVGKDPYTAANSHNGELA